jgi:integrase
MGYGEKRGDYWRARYKIAPGKYRTLADANGELLRFRTKRAAEQAANEEEAKVRGGRWHDPAAARITFGEYANRWYAAQDLALSTMQNYRRHIEEHLLPYFNDLEVGEINRHHVEQWERQERGRGYAAATLKTWRSTLHLILGDAVDDGLRETNPAARGRGKRAGRSRNRGPEKVITDALGILLIAERAALLTGRDDEFVALVTKGYTGIRWGELMGLEAQFIRPGSLRVEWQLHELDGGEFHRCPPKDDSYRTIDTPDFLSGLLTRHVAAKRPEPCRCHGLRYAFNGFSAANGAASRPGAKIVDVARKAGVSAGTVSNALNWPASVSEDRRLRVEAAITELGYVRNASSGEVAPHWRRSGFASWLFYPATTGSYPTRAPRDAHPVPLIADPWPGIPARGRGAAQRAQACWVPIAPGLTPHGLRHTHRTIMEEAGTPPKLMDERLGHEDGSVQARYSHVTPRMRARLMDALTEQWEEALDIRRTMSPGSPVAALDALLRSGERPGRKAEEESPRPRSSPNFLPKPPRNAVRGGLPNRKTAPHLQFHQSGWRDLYPRPLRPEAMRVGSRRVVALRLRCANSPAVSMEVHGSLGLLWCS